MQVFHPNPNDYWRWTQTGLARLFEQNGGWARSTFTGRGNRCRSRDARRAFLHLFAKRAHIAAAARPVVAALNAGAAGLDARVAMLREPVPGALFANFHVTAVKR